MYKNFFGLRENPFNVNPDPRYIFPTAAMQSALAGLTYGIEARKGFLLLTGEVGTGKTTLLNRLLDWLRERRVATAFIFNTQINSSQLFDFILNDFEIPCDSQQKSQSILRLNQWLLERYRDGQTAVIIVDEAQNLSFEVLEEIRLLTNLETSREKLLQIVLSGQPELDEKLRHPQLRQLLQRITLRLKTTPLTCEEMHGYILERLRIAGATGDPVFSSEAMDAVHCHSRGIPRVANLICEHALITAYVENQRPVLAVHVDEAAHEYQFDRVEPTVAPRSFAEPAHPSASDSLLTQLLDRLRDEVRAKEAGGGKS
jgi:general secretion pathway protein A